MRKRKRMLLAIVLLAMMTTYSPALAAQSDEPTILRAGDSAPFAGLLFSRADANRLVTDSEQLPHLRTALEAAEDEIESLRAALHERELEAAALRSEAGLRESIAMMQAENAARCEQRQMWMVIGAGAALVLSQR